MSDIDAKNKGVLYVVATPIGNLDDMTPRAIETLREVDLILAEDTRHSGKLLKKFSITSRMKAFHDHNERKISTELIERLKGGEKIALISDAGTPLVSDPGYYLINSAQQEGIRIVPIPGPCALIAALSASGLPSDKFTFHGFLPSRTKARQKKLQELKSETGTQIFYEAPHRLKDTLDDIKDILGSARMACMARELTKRYETIRTGTLIDLTHWLSENPEQCRGEIVLVVEGHHEKHTEEGEDQRVLEVLLEYLPPSQAVAAAVKLTGGKKNQLYRMAQKKSQE